jgi:hypothetical protein
MFSLAVVLIRLLHCPLAQRFQTSHMEVSSAPGPPKHDDMDGHHHRALANTGSYHYRLGG